jgi:hypothetical protein
MQPCGLSHSAADWGVCASAGSRKASGISARYPEGLFLLTTGLFWTRSTWNRHRPPLLTTGLLLTRNTWNRHRPGSAIYGCSGSAEAGRGIIRLQSGMRPCGLSHSAADWGVCASAGARKASGISGRYPEGLFLLTTGLFWTRSTWNRHRPPPDSEHVEQAPPPECQGRSKRAPAPSHIALHCRLQGGGDGNRSPPVLAARLRLQP